MSLTAVTGNNAGSNAGSNAAPIPGNAKSAAAQRAKVPNQAETGVSNGTPAPTVHANRVGVAAYLAVMNPAPPSSMRTEA